MSVSMNGRPAPPITVCQWVANNMQQPLHLPALRLCLRRAPAEQKGQESQYSSGPRSSVADSRTLVQLTLEDARCADGSHPSRDAQRAAEESWDSYGAACSAPESSWPIPCATRKPRPVLLDNFRPPHQRDNIGGAVLFLLAANGQTRFCT